MNIPQHEHELKNELLTLVIALVEIVTEMLELQAIRRMESGRLSDMEIERLGLALQSLHGALGRLKGDHGIEGAVAAMRSQIDRGVVDLLGELTALPR
ncbi:MAG: gas vesicle protein K [Chloroflexi bacterium]|nr:gas vesicle protein K [Chloroflexota bacterium]